jgi:hypothetical protein
MALALTVASAHGLITSSLDGAPLCLDGSSVRAVVRTIDGVRNPTTEQRVEQRLRRSIPTILDRYQVAVDRRTSCRGTASYVYTLFFADWTRHGDGRPTLNFAATLQVGRWPAPDPNPESFLAGERFDAYDANLLFPEDFSRPFEEELPGDNEAMARQLATAWWDGAVRTQQRRARNERWRLAALATLAGTLTTLLALRFRHRRRRR